MYVGEDAVASSRMADTDVQEGLVSWTWSPDQAGGSINMYMYNNTMSMTNTNFSMDTESAMEVPADRMTAVSGGPEVNINMYMYDNDMSMDNTIFTMKVKP